MSWVETLLLFGASILAGAINAVAGGGTFLTFPMLLFTGMPPTVANATNTMALWPGSLASIGAYRRELTAHKARLPALLAISLAGGLAGALLLLATPEQRFAAMVPYLMLAATLVFAFGRRLTVWLRTRFQPGDHSARLFLFASLALQVGIAVYGGFFGAGIGILMLAMLQLMGLDHIHEMNALKTVLAGAINGIAVVTFILAGAIAWPQALLMMAGAVIGGYGGAHYALRLSPGRIRLMVILIGGGMTAYFFLK